MQYMMLIYDDETSWATMPESEAGAILGQWNEVHQAMDQAGVIRGAGRLRPTGTATTVRVQKGDRTTTDGPFAETKEQLGGYYVLEVPDLDAALAWAAKIPLPEGSIELRPIWEEGDA